MASLTFEKLALVCFDVQLDETGKVQLADVRANFPGKVIDDPIESTDADYVVYFCGDAAKYHKDTPIPESTRIVKDFSRNFSDIPEKQIITLGEIPVNVHGVGVYYRQMFALDKDFFDAVTKVHEFQTLTESDKVSPSHRKGLYISHVSDNDEESQFNLLRCSTNLDGPTAGFQSVDREILDKINDAAGHVFKDNAPFNHVLAQVYRNTFEKMETNGVSKVKERKARIKAHSDKTKDMPDNGLIAFCTFYSTAELNDRSRRSKEDSFDYVYKSTSVLTRLRFKLKDCVVDTAGKLEKSFDLKLYPNSVFMIPLSTNRLYTHEIVPPTASPDHIPTRLGYVVRCSKTDAVHRDGKTYLRESGVEVPLIPPTEDDIKELRNLYFAENTTAETIVYGRTVFSMNDGDYMKPLV